MRGKITKIDDVVERRLTILLESGEALTYSVVEKEDYVVGETVSIEYTPNGFEIRKLPSKRR